MSSPVALLSVQSNASPAITIASTDFRSGVLYFGPDRNDVPAGGLDAAVIPPGGTALATPATPVAAFQTLLAADALRYLTLQLAATKASGHPGDPVRAQTFHLLNALVVES